MPNPAEAFPPKDSLLANYEAGVSVLQGEAERIQDVVAILAPLSADPSDELILPVAAEAATRDGLATDAIDIMPSIHMAVEPFSPKQIDTEGTPNQRWTMDWDAIGDVLNARIAERPELSQQLNTLYLDKAPDMIETTYGPGEAKTLYVVVGGANDQCSFRSVLALASMASPQFRADHGLLTAQGHDLAGQDDREAGWMKDPRFVEDLRYHVAERIEDGEIAPNLLVVGSGKRIIPPTRKNKEGVEKPNAEFEKVSKYLNPNAGLLYPTQGVTEADAMLAGALQEFGGVIDSIQITDLPAAENDKGLTNKLITFDSSVGPVTVLATVGEDAKLRQQLEVANKHKPELFEGINAIMGLTTGIYTWVQRPILREAAAKIGLKNVQVDALGISAHAAGMKRELKTLVGEHTNFLKSAHNVARRVLENAELNAQLDIALGAIALSD